MAFLAEEVHPGSLGSAMGRYIAGTTVGGLAGRLVASSVLDVSNWRIALLGSGAMTLVCTVLFAALLPKSQFFVPKKVRVGTTLRILGVHLRNPVLLIMFGLAFLLMGGFVTVYNYLGYRLVAPRSGCRRPLPVCCSCCTWPEPCRRRWPDGWRIAGAAVRF